jgi:uncharacterized protein YggE
MKPSLLAIAMMLTLALTAAGQQRTDNGPPVIVVTGEGQVRVAPDQAVVRIGILRQAPTAQAAQDQANKVANDILAAITKVGVPPNQVQTSRLTLTPVYSQRGPESNQTPRIVAYQASNIVAVRLVELSKVGPVIDAGLGAGSNEIQGVQFGLRDELAASQQALKQAVTEAQKKAEAIAEGVHAQLGPPIEINENGASVVPRSDFAAPMARLAEAAPTPVSPGEIEVRANVTIRYRIMGFAPKPQ